MCFVDVLWNKLSVEFDFSTIHMSTSSSQYCRNDTTHHSSNHELLRFGTDRPPASYRLSSIASAKHFSRYINIKHAGSVEYGGL